MSWSASRSLAFALAALLPALGACDPQAPPEYLGEPLITLEGQVVSSGPLPPLEAAMLWQRGPPPSTGDQDLATRAPVQGGFPARFVAHLYQPPPAVARRSLLPGEISFARANAAAVPPGVAQAAIGGTVPTSNPLYGIDPDHWVIFLAEGTRPGSLTEWWLGGPLPAGFHLMTVTAQAACLPASELELCVRELVRRGVPDDHTSAPGTARGFCKEPYRLAPAAQGEELLLQLGNIGPVAGAGCP